MYYPNVMTSDDVYNDIQETKTESSNCLIIKACSQGKCARYVLVYFIGCQYLSHLTCISA